MPFAMPELDRQKIEWMGQAEPRTAQKGTAPFALLSAAAKRKVYFF